VSVIATAGIFCCLHSVTSCLTLIAPAESE
jgi:hypothetical protein